MWLWSSRPDAATADGDLLWRAYLRRFDLGGIRSVLVAAIGLLPVLTTAVVLSLATMLVFPFEMATIVAFGGDRLSGTYYGLYNALTGVGVALGNLVTGVAFDAGQQAGRPAALPWLLLISIGAVSAASLHTLDRARRLTVMPAPASAN